MYIQYLDYGVCLPLNDPVLDSLSLSNFFTTLKSTLQFPQWASHYSGPIAAKFLEVSLHYVFTYPSSSHL